MKELLEQEDMPDIQERTVVKGVVVQVSRDEAYVDIGYKQEIPVSKRDLAVPAPDDARDVVKVGDEIDVYIKSLGGDNGGGLAHENRKPSYHSPSLSANITSVICSLSPWGRGRERAATVKPT